MDLEDASQCSDRSALSSDSEVIDFEEVGVGANDQLAIDGIDGFVDENVQPAAPGIDEILQSVGLIEEAGQIYVHLGSGTKGLHVGRIEFIHGVSISIKAVCKAHSGMPASSSSSSSAAPPPLGERRLLLNAVFKFAEKYKRAATWLASGCECGQQDHLANAGRIREEFGMRRH